MKFDKDKARQICEAATPGPWRTANGNGAASVVTEHPDYACQIYLNVRTCEIKDTVDRWKRDATFIASSRSLLPAALRRIEELEDALGSALALTYVADCSRDEGWHGERERLNQILGGDSE